MVDGRSVLFCKRDALLLCPTSQGGVRQYERPALIGSPGQCEMDDVEPGKDSRDDRPKNRTVTRPRKCHGQDRAKSDPGLGCGVRADSGDLREDHGWIGKERSVELAKSTSFCKSVFVGFARSGRRICKDQIFVKEFLDSSAGIAKGPPVHRGVAQPGRAPRLGRGCRQFESGRPDHSFSGSCVSSGAQSGSKLRPR